MNQNVRLTLKREVQAFIEINPSSSTCEVKMFILRSENLPNIESISPYRLNKFLDRNLAKFNETGDCVEYRGGNGMRVTVTNKRVTLRVKNKLD